MYPKSIVPKDFDVPDRIELEDAVLTPISIRSWLKDFDAVRSTVDYIELNPGLEWPDETLGNILFGLSDACYIDKLWKLRASFTYGVMSPDESTELGCLYIYRTRKKGYDAEIISWVRDRELRRGFGEEIFRFAETWVPEVWPFENTTWPGRKISWEEWYGLPDKDPQNWQENSPSYALIPQRLVPDSFQVPSGTQSNRFSLIPLQLSMDTITKNYEAYMMSAEYLKETFRPNDDWPIGTTFEEAIVDVGYFHFYWHTRGAFVYSIRDPENVRELGCLYITSTHKAGFQAEARFWVRESELTKSLEEEIDEFSHNWIRESWPFERVAWPGRDIGWEEWEKLPEWDADHK